MYLAATAVPLSSGSTQALKLLIVDDHHVVRQGIAALIRHAMVDATVLETGDPTDALTLATAHADLDAIILDLAMPGMNGFAALAQFGTLRPDVPVIVLSSSEEPADARRALEAGALGYVPKSASQHSLLGAIRLVMDGEIYVPPLLLGDVIRPAERASRRGPALTERQIEVLRLLVDGRSNKEIARDLDLSEKTVKAHVSAVFRALDVVNRTQAAVAGREAGLI